MYLFTCILELEFDWFTVPLLVFYERIVRIYYHLRSFRGKILETQVFKKTKYYKTRHQTDFPFFFNPLLARDELQHFTPEHENVYEPNLLPIFSSVITHIITKYVYVYRLYLQGLLIGQEFITATINIIINYINIKQSNLFLFSKDIFSYILRDYYLKLKLLFILFPLTRNSMLLLKLGHIKYIIAYTDIRLIILLLLYLYHSLLSFIALLRPTSLFYIFQLL